MEIRIAVARECKWSETRLLHHDGKLLLQLADQRLLRTLARLDFAAGKLP